MSGRRLVALAATPVRAAAPALAGKLARAAATVFAAKLTLVAALVFAAALLLAGPRPARAQIASDLGRREEPLPEKLENIAITERLGAIVPLDLRFVDETGDTVRIGDYFGKGPVLLNLGYYNCPMLCGLVLNGLLAGLQGIEWTPGKEFTIVTESIDPTESPTLARLKKQNVLAEYGRPDAAAGWHFLVGHEESIRALAGAVGFGYAYDEEKYQYIHAAGIMICTPDGRLSRYLYGIQYEPQTLRLALLEASEGKTRSTLDKVLLYCYHYDAAEGRYAPAAMNLMRAGGAAALASLAAVLGVLWRRDPARKRKP
jgi:protein SCO1/2